MVLLSLSPSLPSLCLSLSRSVSYSVEVDFKPLGITPEVVTNSAKRTEARKQIKKMFQERYTQGKNKWFFSKLRF
jgi:large subunit ribosomal protein L27e